MARLLSASFLVKEPKNNKEFHFISEMILKSIIKKINKYWNSVDMWFAQARHYKKEKIIWVPKSLILIWL